MHPNSLRQLPPKLPRDLADVLVVLVRLEGGLAGSRHDSNEEPGGVVCGRPVGSRDAWSKWT